MTSVVCYFIDDLDVSPDFLDYFQALYPLLKYDKTIWCISAWNDNGIDQKIDRRAGMWKKENHECIFLCQDLLHRSDFFPGLGWLLTKTVWNEIKADWPKGLVRTIVEIRKDSSLIKTDFGMIG